MDADTDDDDDGFMPEPEYLAMLTRERHMYAWVLQRYANESREKATELALEFYYYEPPTEQYRGLEFHRSAWDWALRRVLGEAYWLTHPELETESEEYVAESNAIYASYEDEIAGD